MLLIDICFTNASAAEFILYRLRLYLAGRHHQPLVSDILLALGTQPVFEPLAIGVSSHTLESYVPASARHFS